MKYTPCLHAVVVEWQSCKTTHKPTTIVSIKLYCIPTEACYSLRKIIPKIGYRAHLILGVWRRGVATSWGIAGLYIVFHINGVCHTILLVRITHHIVLISSGCVMRRWRREITYYKWRNLWYHVRSLQPYILRGGVHVYKSLTSSKYVYFDTPSFIHNTER